ncbi:uncharacterized membrane protein HdeD (DUF308 family) [Mesorhizobium soli]|uniref:HdeD family acid-resistance protein n=1 Tax=Pseudaminobacter soli (ex Li et al. 2025) TaxID=1295366 RepID=UPI0024760A92|nr:DUF308 domain-containing protein [Mesorhizobium soli]MDH6230377.1 uncharacterized membrane protein HdeD (DUF308 family) [Mesorhizobium soli]
MATNEAKRFEATLTALRGIVMIAAGVLAFLFPEQAIKFVLLAGGVLLLVDGVLGLASSDFSSPRDATFWLALVRNVVCIAAGLIVLGSGILTHVFTLGFLAGLVGLLAIIAGLVEIVSGLMDRERYSSATPAMVSGGLYVVFGLALLFMPLSSAATLTRVVTILIIIYALSLLYRAWRIRTVG